MKISKIKNVLILSLCLMGSTAQTESGPANGTDFVKVLFAEAQNELNVRMSALTKDQVRDLPVDVDTQAWLLKDLELPTGRWTALKFYIANMRLDFQTAPCEDKDKKQASICFFNQDPKDPYVLISLQENRNTTPHQAMAMLIHEAGHFTGEMDHLFLDHVGVQLVQALFAPRSLSFSLSSTEMATNIFSAKQDCENGTSEQAQHLREQALMKLSELCQNYGRQCDFSRMQTVYTGEMVYASGIGFTMQVTCELKAFLAL